ncbi:probable amidase At4g34880 isoform X2 [Quercus lobata]|uniref:probable amidase At4g34880 isoform X2 n=1 Tax=Quercus lobata TaxID=97700 RepID=UPI0012453830|nr:probable amidase At4g34880 isoform X2 [Quercus lobata]
MTSMATKFSPLCFTVFSSLLLILLATTSYSAQAIKAAHGFSSIKEATVHDIQLAFKQNQLSSRKLVELYLKQISRLNPVLKGVLEVNPDALYQADKADHERKFKAHGSLSPLHGIPILLKDNIATKDKLNTTAGSYALLGSVVPRDAGVVTKLRKAGAIILGKATLSEWAHYRFNAAHDGWNARKGRGKSPYTMGDPCGSSSGSAISVAANMAAVSLGTETDGSILCPSSNNLVVGIKPTVGLTSRAGVIPISQRQDSVGPICRTVADAVYVLDAIVGIDHYDNATVETSRYIPKGGYAQFLKTNGLRTKRVGIVRNLCIFGNDAVIAQIFEQHLKTLSNEDIALAAEFKIYINAYLKELVVSPVRSLADLIAFNKKNSKLERLDYGQDLFIKAEKTNGIGNAEKAALVNLAKLTREGFVKLMTKNKLDALVTTGSSVSSILAIGGFPGVIVPAGYDSDGVPFGLSFGGLKGSEPKLIEIAYGFEQATEIRKPPKFKF